MRFVHYSDKQLCAPRSCSQDRSDSRFSKPIGLWISVIDRDERDSWRDCCKAKGIPLKQHRTEIFLTENAKVLWVRNAAEIDSLTCVYGYHPPCMEHERSLSDYTRSAIHWQQLAEQYDGIIIAPYCEERHREELWYYTWDCSSGCIWNGNALKY